MNVRCFTEPSRNAYYYGMDAVELERLLADGFARVDDAIAVRVDGPTGAPGRFSAVVQGVRVEVAWLGRGWPRQVREVIEKPDRPDLVVAPELSPGARVLLGEHGISWVDGTGAARVTLPGVFIRVDGDAPRPRGRGQAGWTPATLAVSEALLVGVAGTVAEVVAATGLSPSTVGVALRFLQERGLLTSTAARGRHARRTVVDGAELLEVYAGAAARMRDSDAIRVGVLWRDPVRGVRDLGARLEQNGVAWSVTGALAADILAPLLTEVDPWEVYVDAASMSGLRQVARDVGLRQSEGGRLLLRPFPTPAAGRLSTADGESRIAVWPRVFSDLRAIGVRGEEAAEHLREQMGLQGE